LRIVCLSAETADLCARLGAWDEVVAVSAYADQAGLPPKPIASGFSSGGADFILKFEPDLVLGYSDVQADLAAALIRAGVNVFVTNQRSLAETVQAMRMVGRVIGRASQVEELIGQFERDLENLRRPAGKGPWVYFEEWPDPVITGIAWVGELIELLGANDLFVDRRGRSAKERITTDEEVCNRAPEIVVASWCGKPVDHAQLKARFAATPAGRRGQFHEIPSADILQPGPRLIRGARTLRSILDKAEEGSRCV
jgi:iron complex transport system substrate-binding protein